MDTGTPLDTWKVVQDRTREALKQHFPIESKNRKLVLHDIHIDEEGVNTNDIRSQEDAKNNKKTWGANVSADISLVDKTTGKTLDRTKMKLLTLPKPTNRYSYIVDGSERQIGGLWKLRSGIYSHIKQNGEVQAEFNLAKPFVRENRIYLPFDPETKAFKFRYGSVHVPLYSMLKAMGVPDEDMKKAWGADIYKANVSDKVEKNITYFYEKRLAKRGVRLESKGYQGIVDAIGAEFDKTKLLPDTTKAALGKPFDKVTGEAMLLASKRALGVARGEHAPEDRDSLVFKGLHGLDDFIYDKITHPTTLKTVKQKAFNNLDRQTKVREILHGDMFAKPVREVFNKSSLSLNPEQVNPLQILSEHRLTTILAAEEGGIKSEYTITKEMKGLNQSHMGYLDPIHTPEGCFDPSTEVFTSKGWIFWEKVTRDTRFACLVEGRLEFHLALELQAYRHQGLMYGLRKKWLDYLVTPNHRMLCRPLDEGSAYRVQRADEMHGKPRVFQISHHPFLGKKQEVFALPQVGGSNSVKNVESVNLLDWAEFLGWHLSEGHNTYDEQAQQYHSYLFQSTCNPKCCERIEALLDRLPFKWNKAEREDGRNKYGIASKQLSSYLRQFGRSWEKFLPEDVFSWPLDARRRLLESLLLGDGRLTSEHITQRQTSFTYTTSSERLAQGVERLAISLGYACSFKSFSDKRGYRDIYEVCLLRHSERSSQTSSRNRCSPYYTIEYDGMVYCATVPGSFLYVRRNGKHPLWLGNSRVGVTLHLPTGVRKVGNEAQAIVYDLKEHKITWIPPTEMHSNHVVLPDQVSWGKDQKPKPLGATVKMKDPKTQEIVDRPFKDGRYLLVNANQLFNETTNLIPFLQNDHGTRAAMAARQATQALSLAHREIPLVQVKSAGPKTWEQSIGEHWSHSATVDGTIHEIRNDPQNGMPHSIIIKTPDGKKREEQIYNNFPLNDSKTYLHSTPVVKVGDTVKKGQLLADTNFTKDGHLALGTNLRVGYLAYKGYNVDDGIVISESAAKKLSSEHLHRHSIEIDPDVDHLSKKKFIAFASSSSKKFTKEQADKIGEDGIIHVGQKVNHGDILIAAVGKPSLSIEAQRIVGRLDKKMFNLKDKSVVWDQEYPGEVTKVVRDPSGKGVTVYVRTIEPATIGDKIVGRQANKAIITQILPDHEMPKIGTPDGAHIELLMNPSGVPSRINLGQMLETAASKIARKTGKPYLVQNFAGADKDYTQQVKDDLKKHGLTDTDAVFDAKTNRKLGDVMVGDQYIMKLKHQVEKKEKVRSHTQGYSLDHSPLGSGSEHGGQAIGQLDFYALLAHGARHNLREMATYKADQQLDEVFNERAHIDFWDKVRTGAPLPAPKPTFAYRKFETLLTGMGINIKKEGHELHLQPLTDKGVLALSNGEIKDPGRVLRGKDAKELEKGLFDPKITGGLPNDVGKGLKWSHITLAEPIPNPVFVGDNQQHPGPAVMLSGLKFKEFEDVVMGKKTINGMTGGRAIENLLKKVDVKSELKATRELLPKLHGTALDRANRKAKYLIALDQLGMKPAEAYIMNHIPVIPPRFRPIVPMADGNLRTDDINGYYHKLGLINNKLKDPIKELPDEENQHLREQLWDITRAMQGLGGKPVYDSNRKLKGIMDLIAGETPKTGFFQSKIMKRRQDLSMRSTIIPEPAMHIDHVGLPKNAAMELYKPFVIREMGRMGIDQVQARKHMKDASPTAWNALQRAMDQRPLLLKRDPTLHKYNIMAFKPKLINGRAIKIHPLVTEGYNADFDGDSCVGAVICCNMIPPAVGSEQEENMPHTGPLASYQVIEIRDFPRLPETKIVKPSGIIEYDVPEQVFVPAYLNGQMKLMPATKFSIHPDCEEWKVESLNGRELTVSSDHSLALLNPETLVVEKVPPVDSVGLFFPTMRSLDNPTTYSHLPGVALSTRGGARQMVPEVPLSYESGWFIGSTIGDGWVSADTLNFASGAVEEVRQEWSRLASYLSAGSKVSDRGTHHEFDGSQCYSVKTVVSSTALSRWIEPMIGKGARNKHLPVRFLEMPLEFRQGLFCGLIDTDGTVNWNERGQFAMSFTTTSERLSGEMMLLALSLGLPCNRSEYQNREKPAYILTFSIRPVQGAPWIKLFTEKKRKALEELQGGEKRDYGRNDFVPLTSFARPALLDLLRKAGATVRAPNRNQEAFSLYVILGRSESKITRETAKHLWSFLQMEKRARQADDAPAGDVDSYLWRWFGLVLDESVGWDVVTKAEPTGQTIEMYDLTVPESWTFTMANGAVVWDTMSAFVPLSDDAVREAHTMLPSNNLFSSTHGGAMNVPKQEGVLGIHLLSKWGKDSGKKFSTYDEALKAKEAGKLHPTDVISIGGKKTTLGRLMIAHPLPDEIKRDPQFVAMMQNPKTVFHSRENLEKHQVGLTDLLERVAHQHPKDFPEVTRRLNDLGSTAAYELGHTISIHDLDPQKHLRDPILKKADAAAARINASGATPAVKHDKVVDIYNAATKDLDDIHKKYFDTKKNGIYDMVSSGARGKMAEFRQMNIAPMLVKDSVGRTLTTPVRKSYSEGLDTGDYWTTLSGARMGQVMRSISTSEPGALTKEMVNIVANSTIATRDCGTAQGISMGIHHEDVQDRILATPIRVNGKELAKAGTTVTPDLTALLKKHKIDQVVVRSPLKCQHPTGLCATCYGLNENGKLHEVGTNIGIIAAQAMGEPATQLSMDAFHCNHADSIVFVRSETQAAPLAVTMETFFDMVDEPVTLMQNDLGDEEVKVTKGWEVYDGRWVSVTHVRRHAPDRPMVSVSNGRSMVICQDNHPLAVWKNLVSCPKCGYHRAKKPSPASRGKQPYCPECGTRWIPPENPIGEMGFSPPVEITKGKVYLHSDLHPVTQLEPGDTNLPVHPYVAGMFIAEGYVRRYAQKNSVTKKPYAVNISQLPGAVKDKLRSCLPQGVPCSENTKSITMHSLELGFAFEGYFGVGSRNKALPSNFIYYTTTWLTHFLCGLLDGDGTVKRSKDGPDQLVLDTTSFELAQQVVFISTKLGIPANLHLSKNRPLTRNQGYRVALTMTQKAINKLEGSVKIAQVKKLSPAVEPEVREYRLAGDVRPVLYTHEYVYDLTTTTGTLYVGGIKSHNSGGVAVSRGGGATNKITRLHQLLEVNKTLPNAATLSSHTGKVQKVELDKGTNGWNIHINNERHYVQPQLTPLVKAGDEVQKGHVLSSGVVNPHKLLELTDIHKVQNYLTDELHDTIYKSEGVKRRNIETVVRSMTNLTHVRDPGHSDHLTGDVALRSVVENHNRNLKSGEDPIKHKPLLRSAQQVALDQHEDWLARLNFQRLNQTVLEGAAKGWKTNLHGANPIPAYAYGSSFGLPPAGVPKHHY